MTILKYDEVDIEKINYSKPEKIGQSYFGSISYGDNLKPLYIQTPKLTCINGILELKEKKNPQLEVELTKGNFDIYDLFLSLDDQNIKTTVYKSQEWFQKDIPLDAIDDMYKRTTKPFKKDTTPTIKFRLPVIKNEIQCSVYNQQKVFVDLDEIKEGSEVILILHIRGLKILKQYFYCDCYISQIKVFLSKDDKFNILNEYLIEDDEIKEEDNDIVDEEIIADILKQKEFKQKEEEKKKNIQAQIQQLQQQLDNL